MNTIDVKALDANQQAVERVGRLVVAALIAFADESRRRPFVPFAEGVASYVVEYYPRDQNPGYHIRALRNLLIRAIDIIEARKP
jgi:hypothetical protein